MLPVLAAIVVKAAAVVKAALAKMKAILAKSLLVRHPTP
jgi:hypothetical protein